MKSEICKLNIPPEERAHRLLSASMILNSCQRLEDVRKKDTDALRMPEDAHEEDVGVVAVHDEEQEGPVAVEGLGRRRDGERPEGPLRLGGVVAVLVDLDPRPVDVVLDHESSGGEEGGQVGRLREQLADSHADEGLPGKGRRAGEPRHWDLVHCFYSKNFNIF